MSDETDKTVKELEIDMLVAVDLEKAKQLATSLTFAASLLCVKYGPGPVVAAMAIALGEMAAVTKPDDESQEKWYGQVCNLVAGAYVKELKKEG